MIVSGDELDFLNNVGTGKRSHMGNITDEPTSIKKQKTEETATKSGSGSSTSSTSSSKIKSKGKVLTEPAESEATYVQKPKLTYDASNKFWGYVEPYCADLTMEDIKTLEDSLTSKVDVNEYFKIPPLGQHYSEVWAKEDLVEEHQQSMKIDKKKINNNNNNNNNNGSITLDTLTSLVDGKDSTATLNNDELCPYGKFTKILVAALVDENIMAPMTEHEVLENNMEMKTGCKKLSPSNSANMKSLETAIKDELFSLGKDPLQSPSMLGRNCWGFGFRFD